MATWAEFAAAEPERARKGFALLSIPVAYLATVKRDGSPRLHPLSPIFAGGRLFIAIESTAPRRFDLANDGRYAIHGLPPMLSPDYDEFEINLTGRARRVTDTPTRDLVNSGEHARNRPSIAADAWLFELDMALATVWNHKMVQVDGQWIPALADHPTATRNVWRL